MPSAKIQAGLRAAPVAALVAFLTGCSATPAAPSANPQPTSSNEEKITMTDIATLGRRHVERLAAGEHAAVYAELDDTMKGAMTLAQLGELWPGLVAQAGALKGIRGVRTEKRDQLDAVIVTCELEKALLDVTMVLDPERKITGLWIKPADQSGAWTPPDYAKLSDIEEIEVSVGTGDWVLPGTMTFPKAAAPGTCPGLVLVHGSGPNDRDETVGANKPFKDLALGLASRGVCVLRYEKRTRHLGKLVMEKLGESLTVKEETVDDALGAATVLRTHATVDPDRVFVLGHSLGGYAIPRIAKRGEGLRGFIILAGSTRPLEDLVLEQVSYISNADGTLSDQEKQSIAAIEKQVAAVKSLTEKSEVAAGALPLGIPVRYWLDLRAHDPVKLIAGETRPLLVLQGDRDYQVTLADFAGWEKALGGKSHATLKRYPKLNHLFIAGEGKSTPAEYQQPGHVDVAVIDDIAAFMKQ